MSSSSMCQTVCDTLRTVIYDTVHTVSFDTVRTFDTVKVQIDSNYSVQILHDAQQFYSTAFSDIQFMIGILVSIFLAGVGIFFRAQFHSLEEIVYYIQD